MPVPLNCEWTEPQVNVPSRCHIDGRLRLFDMDDFYILAFLNEGKSMADCARALSLTPSAVTQRMRKIEDALEVPILQRGVRGTMLTGPGTTICQTAFQAVPNLESLLRLMKAS